MDVVAYLIADALGRPLGQVLDELGSRRVRLDADPEQSPQLPLEVLSRGLHWYLTHGGWFAHWVYVNQ